MSGTATPRFSAPASCQRSADRCHPKIGLRLRSALLRSALNRQVDNIIFPDNRLAPSSSIHSLLQRICIYPERGAKDDLLYRKFKFAQPARLTAAGSDFGLHSELNISFQC